MPDIFGLDFGTTNTLAAFIDHNGTVLPLTNLEDNLPHPSVVQYHGGDIVVGREAKKRLAQIGTGVLGEFVRSPKSFLGTGTDIHVGGVAREPAEVIADIFRFIRSQALDRKYPGMAFDHAVFTIPVRMNGRARRELREAALKAGMHVVQFVHEPLAALYGYIRNQANFRRRLAEFEGQLALVFDWGGGTLDVTLCRFTGGNLVQIKNTGDNTVGGDRFDERLLRYVKDHHAKRHGLESWPGEMLNAEARLIYECETAKIALSGRSQHTILVANYLRADGDERNLQVLIARDELIDLTRDLVFKGIANIDAIIDSVGIKDSSIALCLATGGMVKMPYIREQLLQRFGPARTPGLDNGDQIIAEGAAWIAHDALRLRLAKPFEVLHSDNTYATLLEDRTALPSEHRTISATFGMYCVDPRDGFAKFQLSRPRWPGRSLQTDARDPYAILTLQVDSTAVPLSERLQLDVQIDHDLVATVGARSTRDSQTTEIHDLEFGLGIDNTSPPQEPDAGGDTTESNSSGQAQPPGAVRLRSNVCFESEHNADTRQFGWAMVPGELLEELLERHRSSGYQLTERQQAEAGYYKPCAICGRLIYEINLNGCDRRECAGQSIFRARNR